MIARRTSQFKKDVKRALRRGKDPEKLKEVMENILEGKPLSPRLKDHTLKGAYRGHRECHLEPDWLLIYFTNRRRHSFRANRFSRRFV